MAKKQAKKKAKKKRANKYEQKVKINASFMEALKIAVSDKVKKEK